MRIVVTGAAGGLAQALLERLAPGDDLTALSKEKLDVGDHAAVMRTVSALRPDVVLNLAAMTNVDACETTPELAYRANTIGPHNLALAARRCGATLLHVSTDCVFDGRKPLPYDELDDPNPISVYGRSKLGGERAVRRHVPEHFIVRTGWVFGGGKDHLTKAVARMEQGERAGGVTDRVGTPTFVGHLAERLLPLVATRRFGTYHLAGPEPTTWFDVLTRIRFLAGMPVNVERQEWDSLGLPAARPANAALTSVLVHDLPVAPMPALDVALKEFLDGRR